MPRDIGWDRGRRRGGSLPSDLTLSFKLADEWTADVIASFCHFIHFFTDEASAADWTGDHPGTFVLSLGDAIALGRIWGQQVFPDLAPDR